MTPDSTDLDKTYDLFKSKLKKDHHALDEYIDRRITEVGDKIRIEMQQSMSNYREEMKETNKILRTNMLIMWGVLVAYIGIYILRVLM